MFQEFVERKRFISRQRLLSISRQRFVATLGMTRYLNQVPPSRYQKYIDKPMTQQPGCYPGIRIFDLPTDRACLCSVARSRWQRRWRTAYRSTSPWGRVARRQWPSLAPVGEFQFFEVCGIGFARVEGARLPPTPPWRKSRRSPGHSRQANLLSAARLNSRRAPVDSGSQKRLL